ncbi:MAG: hypothetical protein N2045_02365 [Fimbriimonadales bacterium]|nr:hypothetical protein [Fimbriimonadales bacterium]
MARRAVRVAAILCLVGLWQTVPAQTFQRINQPFTCPNSENFDNISAGVYSTLTTAVGTFNPMISGGAMLVTGSPPPPLSTPHYLWGRSTDIEWVFPQPACKVGGYFRAVALASITPPSSVLVNFYDAQNLYLGSDTVSLTTNWQWAGWQFQTPVSRIELIGLGGSTPGYFGLDNLQFCPCSLQSVCDIGCQIWDRCAPSTISTAEACVQGGYSFPMPRIAFDDWVAPSQPAAVLTIQWWGVVHHWGQLFAPGSPWRARQFIIRFFPDANGDCTPDEVLNPNAAIYTRCVKPFWRFAGTDCLGRTVFHFWTSFWGTGLFSPAPNTRYWVQIAEDNHASVRPNMVDFEWSGTCQARGCQAVQMFVDNQGTLSFAPVFNVCQNQPMDLAFCLGYIYIVISNPFPPNNPAKVSLRTPDGEPVWDGEAVSDEQGQMEIFPDVAPGTYILTVRMGGMLPYETRVNIQPGVPNIIRNPAITLGDLNGDGVVDDADLLVVLFNFGAGR